MATASFKRRQRAKQQRVANSNGFVTVAVGVAEAERLKKEAEEKKLEMEKRKQEEERRKREQDRRQREEDESKIRQMYEESLVNDDLEYMRIPLKCILSRKKEITEVLKYKKGAEKQLKGKARYLGTSKSSLQRKKLPTAQQNGAQLMQFGFTAEKRKRGDENDEDRIVPETEIRVAEAMEDMFLAEVSIDDIEEINVGDDTIIDYEQEEDLEDDENHAASVSNENSTKLIEDIEEMERLIPLLEEKHSCLIVSDSDQQQTSRAKFDLRKYNAFRYASLIAYYKKRCFDNKKKVITSIQTSFHLLFENYLSFICHIFLIFVG